MSPDRKGPAQLTARSVLASVLLGTSPPWLPTRRLVRTAELFGISEGTTRTALSRMVAAGEAEGVRDGYRLVGRLVARQDRQSASRRASVRPWAGSWELAAVDGDRKRPAADRAALREALGQLRLVELREGLWGRPDNLEPERSPGASAVAATWCRWWRGAVPEPAPDAAALWDLTAWEVRAADLRSEMEALLVPLGAEDLSALAAGFVTSADVLRHLQADPLLPPELLPPDWPGDALRAEYDRYDRVYRAVLRRWLEA
ncbi:MAG: PaaX family transcriptional regulator C-terminal domain-containing protein [Acidimicrobiales bacterium]|nr:PaaX family transcriptional regulator C-terminal domain-containing protein [Acidimicrobiales bacterium]